MMRSYPHLSAEAVAAMADEAGDLEAVLAKQDLWRDKHLRDANAMAFMAMLGRTDDRIGSLFAADNRTELPRLLARKADWFRAPLERCGITDPDLLLDMQLTAIAAGKPALEEEWRLRVRASAEEQASPDADGLDEDGLDEDAAAAVTFSKAYAALADERHDDLLAQVERLEAIWAERRSSPTVGKSAITIAKSLLAIHNGDAQALATAFDFRERFLVNWLSNYADIQRPAQLFDVFGQAALALARRRGLQVKGNAFSDSAFLP